MTADPIAAAERALARIEAWDDPALFLCRVPPDAVRARATALAAEGPRGRALFGKTAVVKDNIDVAGLPTTAACPAYAYTPAADAPAVARLLDAGAILLGKTNLDQFATGLVGTRSPYGVPRNALDAALIPGGSSSGSATAVAAGVADFALGTDTAGSGRVPAMANGIVGLKGTPGLVPTRGVIPACRSLDCVSVFARSVAEAAAVVAVIAGDDAADPYAIAPPPHWRATPAPQPRWRVAVPDAATLTFDGEGERALFLQAAAALAAVGGTVVSCDVQPFLALAPRLYDGAWVAERTAALRPMLEQPDALHPITRAILQAGLERRTVDAFDDFHRAAEARRQARTLFASADALLLPTAPGVPSLAQVAAAPVAANSRLGTYTNWVNPCGLAAIAIPVGRTDAGRPFGVQLIGPGFSEARLAGLAAALHAALGGPAAPAPPELAADETTLFAIGAHMAGLPLNPQLVGHGGRFLREAATAPLYALYDLGNRPGLVRVPQGARTAGEVWALPTGAIGPFLAEIPPPLGFGRVTLEDGSTPIGFLCEAAGAAGAPDITARGGWRAHLAAKGDA